MFGFSYKTGAQIAANCCLMNWLCLPVSFSPKRVRNMVKLRGPGASDIIPSTTASVGSCPKSRGGGEETDSLTLYFLLECLPKEANISLRSSESIKPSLFWSIMLKAFEEGREG